MLQFLAAILPALAKAGSFAATKAVPWLAKNVMSTALSGMMSGNQSGAAGGGGDNQGIIQMQAQKPPIQIPQFPVDNSYTNIIGQALRRYRGGV